MDLTTYLPAASAGLILGVSSFAHCAGMCGPFALHLAGGPFKITLARQLLWHLGKTSMYALLGALVGAVGAAVRVPGLDNLQQILAFAAGGVMILMGLVVMGLWPRRARPVGKDGLGATLFRQFFAAPSAGGALVLGMACGLLPCPILVAMLAQSLASRSVLAGAIMLAGLGVGTMAGLLPVGLAGSWARRLTRRWAAAVGGIVLVLLGAVTILRGTGAFHQVLGCPGQEQSDCCHGKQ